MDKKQFKLAIEKKLKSEGMKSIIAAVLCAVIGILVGYIILFLDIINSVSFENNVIKRVLPRFGWHMRSSL